MKSLIVRLRAWTFIPVLALLLGYSSQSVGSLAEDAFYALERDPFSWETREAAIENIGRARELNADDPWVAIARSRLALEIGYRGGSRFRSSNFHPNALKSALHFARQGVTLGPDVSVAYSQLARVQIIHDENREAWETLNIAHAKDPDNFYPWYFRSVIAVQMRDRDRAERAIGEAEKRIVNPMHQRFALSQRHSIVMAMGTEEEKEASYLAMIEFDPDSSYAYGNYGTFLLRRERYEEAETMLEKAVSINAYPAALRDLEEARNRGQ